MRVSIVTESFLPTFNGVTTSVCRVLDRLAVTGHEAMIVCPGPAPETYQGSPVRTVPGVNVRGFRAGIPTHRVQRFLEEWQPDVVHAASPFGLGARGLAAARNAGLPRVAIFQTDMASYLAQHAGPLSGSVSGLAWRWLRHVHSLADLTLAPSSATMDSLVANGIPRTARWARGVDTTTYHPDRRASASTRELRDHLAPHGETIVGYVGRLAPEKGLERLTELAELPDVRVVLVGDGPSRTRLEKLLPSAVFLGYRQGAELADAYAALDVFVHTGIHETFGQTLQEAMAGGLPVVAPAAGGPLDIVRPGVTGLLFDPERAGSLRESVGGLAADPAMRDRMGRHGRSEVEQRSWAVVVDELIGHYADVLAPTRSGRAA